MKKLDVVNFNIWGDSTKDSKPIVQSWFSINDYLNGLSDMDAHAGWYAHIINICKDLGIYDNPPSRVFDLNICQKTGNAWID